jgi:hypothetical protein
MSVTYISEKIEFIPAYQEFSVPDIETAHKTFDVNADPELKRVMITFRGYGRRDTDGVEIEAILKAFSLFYKTAFVDEQTFYENEGAE